MNNARRTLNVRAKNSQFPLIVSLAFAACFMHFIISGGVSEEKEAWQLWGALISVRGGVLRSYRTSFERQISQPFECDIDSENNSFNGFPTPTCVSCLAYMLYIH